MRDELIFDHHLNPWKDFPNASEFIYVVEINTAPGRFEMFKTLSYLRSERWINAVVTIGSGSFFHEKADYYFFHNYIIFKDQTLAAMMKMQLS